MNAPLAEHIRRALEAVTLDENPQSGFCRRHTYAGGKAGCGVFVFELVRTGDGL